MTFRKTVYAIAGGFALLALASCGTDARSQKVKISVAVGANGLLVLSIQNPTAHVILFDDPRLSPSATRFDWELFSGRDVIATSDKTRTQRDPLIAGHLSTGPVDIWPNGPLRSDLTNYFPQLANEALMSKADSFLWYCRVWDQTAARWIQASGTVPLHSKPR